MADAYCWPDAVQLIKPQRAYIVIHASLEAERINHPGRALRRQRQGVVRIPVRSRRKLQLTRLRGQRRRRDGDLKKVKIEVSSRDAVVRYRHGMRSGSELAQQSSNQNVFAGNIQVHA